MGLENLPEKMTACQVVEFKQPYRIHDIPTPKDIGPHDLVVKIAVASFCHTDMMVQDGAFGSKLPVTASHEGVGTLVAMGSKVEGFKEGDRIMCGVWRNLCGVCSECLGPERNRHYCTNAEGIIGLTVDGAFAEYVLCDSRMSVKIPDGVDFMTAAPLACAGCTSWRGVLQADCTAGEWVAIVGSGGGLGHLGIQFAKAVGLKVVGIDARDEGLELSKACGADVVIDAREGDKRVVEEVHKVTNGEGVTATINVSDAKSAAATACRVTKMHGTMVQIAQPEEICIPFPELIFRDIHVKGSLLCSPAEAKQMLDIVAKHNVKVKSNPFTGLQEIPKLVELAHSGKMQGKGVVVIEGQ